MTDLVGYMWGRATLYVVPEGSESSWARTLLRTSPEEVCAALEGQADVEEAVQNAADARRGSSNPRTRSLLRCIGFLIVDYAPPQPALPHPAQHLDESLAVDILRFLCKLADGKYASCSWAHGSQKGTPRICTTASRWQGESAPLRTWHIPSSVIVLANKPSLPWAQLARSVLSRFLSTGTHSAA